jgi:cytochrome c biogenesis protein CcdA/glutaredoxin
MQRWVAILCGLLLIVSLIGSSVAEECITPVSCPVTPSTDGTAVADICVYYFYGQSCPHCARIKPFIDEMMNRYPRIQVFSYEIYFNATNQAMFRDFITRYEISQEGVPALFIGDRALIGENTIRDNLEASIQYFYTHDPICPTTYIKNEGGPHDISPGQAINLTIPSVIVAAVVDSINPCAFAVLIFLLVYLTSLQVRNRMLSVGVAYILSVFTVYLLSGMGFFALVQTTGLTDIVFKAAAIIAILAGIVNLKDFFWYGKGISLSIPESQKESIKNFVMKASIPSAIILGGLVSMFELPCTGGIYLAILSLLSSKMTLIQGIPYLLVYNVIFVLPLFVILFGVYYGVSPETLESWRGGERKWMRLAMGIVMVALGGLMLSGML